MVYVALLRGINVGGNRKVEMARLKETFEKLGFKEVRTFINSGNVVFKTTGNPRNLANMIEEAIKEDFGFDVPTLVVTLSGIKKLVLSIPEDWVNDKEFKCDVMFLWPDVDKPSIIKEFNYNNDIEELRYFPGAVVWRIERKLAPKSRVFKLIGTNLHKRMTIRNPNTVRKLYQLMQEIE